MEDALDIWSLGVPMREYAYMLRYGVPLGPKTAVAYVAKQLSRPCQRPEVSPPAPSLEYGPCGGWPRAEDGAITIFDRSP